MKIKAGNKIIPIFEKKKAAPVQGHTLLGANPGFPRPSQSFQKSIGPGTRPNYPSQGPVFKPGPLIYPGVSGAKKEKQKDIAKIIANLPKDELYAWISIIVGLIFILVGVFLLL
ncbi:MAG: hypothetical protein KKF74_03975 [Nanoarchaeota archaeon]|nr:hypothetical protein [Nanoarchaeota archaeon]